MTSIATLTLYFREGCHLCDDMQASLTELLDPVTYELERVDIDADPQLKSQYNELVPLLALGNTELCRHFLDLKTVQRALAGYNT
jgi:hypothetical protein